MSQETRFQWPAFQDVLKYCPTNEASMPPPGVRLKSSSERNFTNRGQIPLGWFKNQEFLEMIDEQFGKTSEAEPMIQLVFNTISIVRPIIIERDGKVIEEKASQPEIPIWTSLGGWSAARADQSFKGPGWSTKFIQL